MTTKSTASRMLSTAAIGLLTLGLAGCGGGALPIAKTIDATPTVTSASTPAPTDPATPAGTPVATTDPTPASADPATPARTPAATTVPAPTPTPTPTPQGIDGRWCPAIGSMDHDCVTIKYPKISTDSGYKFRLYRSDNQDGTVRYDGPEAPLGDFYPAGMPIFNLPDYYAGTDHPDQDRVWSSQAGTMLLRETAESVGGFPAELQGTWCARNDTKNCFSVTELKASHRGAFVSSTSKSDDVPGAKDFAICLSVDVGWKECTTSATMFLRYFPEGVGWDCAKAGKEGKLPGGLTTCKPDYTAAHDPSKPRLIKLPSHQHDKKYIDSVPMYRTDR